MHADERIATTRIARRHPREVGSGAGRVMNVRAILLTPPRLVNDNLA
jgi:hypothetical protein